MEAVGAPVASVKRWETGDIGNPHVVCEVDDPDEIDLALAGPAIEAHFDDGANVHFVSVSGTDEISLRVWERGAGITNACGTGATVSADVFHRWGLVDRKVIVRMPGGDALVDVGDPTTSPARRPMWPISSCLTSEGRVPDQGNSGERKLPNIFDTDDLIDEFDRDDDVSDLIIDAEESHRASVRRLRRRVRWPHRANLPGAHRARRRHPCRRRSRGDRRLTRRAGAAGRHRRRRALDRVVQRRSSPDAATYVGSGKAKEIKAAANAIDADTVVFDDELTPAQQYNLEKILGRSALDRTAVILDIFAQNASSQEGKAQVELAQLRYRLPRLRSSGRTFSQQGGGIGTRGPGETQLEVDRRRLVRRVHKLEGDLRKVQAHRETQSKQRSRTRNRAIALVGYTNAGKSTLLNRLAGADVHVEDRLFATLDATTRRLALPGGETVFATDTVGFVRKCLISSSRPSRPPSTSSAMPTCSFTLSTGMDTTRSGRWMPCVRCSRRSSR